MIPKPSLKNIKLDLEKYWKKDKVLKLNKPEAHETAATDTVLLKTHCLDFVLLGSEQMLERGHKDWEGSWGCRMAQEGSGDIRERKDAAAEMVNATVKFRKMMQTLIKHFSRFNCEMLDKISSSYGSKTLEKNLQPSSKFNPKNVWVIHL